MDHHDQSGGTKRARFSLSQETITILTVGVSLAAIILVNQGDMRAEGRADRETLRAEARAERAEARAERELMRAEGRASREAFERRIIQLVEKQGTLNGLVDGLRNPIPSLEK